MRITALLLAVLLSASACENNTGIQDVTGGLGGDLPANGKVFVFGPPLDIAFARVDRGDNEILSHTRIGRGGHAQVGYIIEPGEVAPGETITVQSLCDTCTSSGEVTFGESDDVTAPALRPGALALSAIGERRQPQDLFISEYFVALTGPGAVEESPLLIRFTSDEADVLVQTLSFDASADIATEFAVDGGIERTICFTITFMDAAGNETALPDAECVHLDPATARPWGEPPPPIG